MSKSMTQTQKQSKTAGSRQLGSYQQIGYGSGLSELPPHLKLKLSHLLMMSEKSKRSTANPSFGWSLRAPQKGKQRHTLMDKCGKSCFLLPEKEGFPVCAKYDLNPKCKIDCGGVLSAYRRANQYGHKDVSKSAKTLSKKAKCSWAH